MSGCSGKAWLGLWIFAAGVSALAGGGCAPSSPSVSPAGGPASGELPPELAGLIPPGATLCHSEAVDSPAAYRLWIFRDPEGAMLEFPDGLPGFERHDLPGSILDGFLGAKAPRLERGNLRGQACRFTHWAGGGAEYQVREAMTDRGWFATVEQLPR